MERLAARRRCGYGSRIIEDSYWIIIQQAMAELVSRARVKQLAQRGFLPAVKADSGVWVFRRHQLR